MANREEQDRALRHGGNRVLATRCFVLRIRLTLLSGVLCAAVLPETKADDSHAAKGVSRQVQLEEPGNAKPMLCDVVPIFDSSGKPRAYFMDVDSALDYLKTLKLNDSQSTL